MIIRHEQIEFEAFCDRKGCEKSISKSNTLYKQFLLELRDLGWAITRDKKTYCSRHRPNKQVRRNK